MKGIPRSFAWLLVLTLMFSFAAPAAMAEEDFLQGEPLKISMYYSDNATLPFKEDWLTVKTIQEKNNVDRVC